MAAAAARRGAPCGSSEAGDLEQAPLWLWCLQKRSRAVAVVVDRSIQAPRAGTQSGRLEDARLTCWAASETKKYSHANVRPVSRAQFCWSNLQLAPVGNHLLFLFHVCVPVGWHAPAIASPGNRFEFNAAQAWAGGPGGPARTKSCKSCQRSGQECCQGRCCGPRGY